jgi:UDP-N-acetylglucosamine acyltransferase
MSGVDKDVIPYGSVVGNRAELGGLNMTGLKRRGIDRDTIHALRGAYRMIFEGGGALADNAAQAREAYLDVAAVRQIADFIDVGGSRSFCIPRDG